MKESKKKADKIIYGNIYTVDKKQPRAEAVAIKDGKFIYVGDEAGAKEYIGEGKILTFLYNFWYNGVHRNTSFLIKNLALRRRVNVQI